MAKATKIPRNHWCTQQHVIQQSFNQRSPSNKSSVVTTSHGRHGRHILHWFMSIGIQVQSSQAETNIAKSKPWIHTAQLTVNSQLVIHAYLHHWPKEQDASRVRMPLGTLTLSEFSPSMYIQSKSRDRATSCNSHWHPQLNGVQWQKQVTPVGLVLAEPSLLKTHACRKIHQDNRWFSRSPPP